MRIIGGKFRGLALASVGKGDAAAHLRPTTDRVRESLFNILMSRQAGIHDARVLDLFAGTGALGLEALSRGAAQVTFVDDGRKAGALLRENVTKCRADGETTLIRRDATRLGPNPAPAFDLIFLDPPYGKGLGARALAAAQTGGWIAPGALVVWEESSPQTPPEGFVLLDRRHWGDTHLTLITAPQ